jgi:cell division protein FtsX
MMQQVQKQLRQRRLLQRHRRTGRCMTHLLLLLLLVVVLLLIGFASLLA